MRPFLLDRNEILVGLQPGGRGGTGLADVMGEALQEIRDHATNRDRAMIVISDAVENSSDRPDRVFKELAASEIKVYFVSPVPEGRERYQEELDAQNSMSRLAQRTGGFWLDWRPRDAKEHPWEEIAQALDGSYLIGWRTPPELAGKAVEIRVAGKKIKLRVGAGWDPAAVPPSER